MRANPDVVNRPPRAGDEWSCVVAWLRQITRAQPDRPAFFFEGGTWSYARLWQRATVVASALRALPDFEPGRRFALVGANTPDYLAAYFGIMLAGGVVVPLNDRERPEDLAQQIGTVEARLCLVGDVADHLRDGLAAAIDVAAIADLDAPPHAPEALPGADQDATILMTSGSTGRPKGVCHTHGSLLHAAFQIAVALPFDRDGVSVCFLPFFASIPEQVLPALLTGGALEIVRRFDVDAVCRACERGTSFDAVPTIIARLLDEGDHRLLRRLQWMSFASEPMPPPLLERWWETCPGSATYTIYGMTEMLPISYATPAMLKADPRTVGVPHSTSRVGVIDAALEPVAAGTEGEITCASPALMRGYLNEPAATAATFTQDGAIRTGDLGTLGADGQVRLTGRLKDLIISGGLNIAPAELEAAACRHPRVAAAAAVGIPDERWGETPVIVAVAASGNQLTPAELLEHCRSQLAGYKRPSAAAIVPQLPQTGIGKSAKSAIRDAVLRGEVELVRAR
jgi:fatty-acyl-CoA synthase